jgi:hypothetical protein
MNTSQDSWLEDVPFEECLALLREGSVGRIAVVPDVDQPPIVVPVNYRLVEPSGLRWVALTTRPGNVIDRAPMNVAFEIDRIDPAQHQGWSVLVLGMLHHVDPDAADFRDRFNPEPGILAERDRWLAIEPFSITGRRLHAAEREWAGSVALGDAWVRGRQWWDAPISCSSGSRSSELGVRRVPVPSRDHCPRGALVPAVWAVVPGRRRVPHRTRDRGRPRHGVPVGPALHTAPRGRRPTMPTRGRRPLVCGRDLRQGRRPVALRVPGSRPVRPDHRRLRLSEAGHPRRAMVLRGCAPRAWRAGRGSDRPGPDTPRSRR